MFNNITKGLRTFAQGYGLADATIAAGSILFEGSGPAAAALSASGAPVAAGSAVAVATTVLYATFVFAAIAACAIGPALLFNYLTSNTTDDVSCDTNVASNDVSCDLKTDVASSFTALDLPAYEVEVTGIDAAAAAA